MLPREHRFSFKEKLPRKTLRSKSFSIRYDQSGKGLKVAVVISKKVDKRSTVRNLIKRKVLEEVQKNVGKTSPLNLIFYVKKEIDVSGLGKEISLALTSINKI